MIGAHLKISDHSFRMLKNLWGTFQAFERSACKEAVSLPQLHCLLLPPPRGKSSIFPAKIAAGWSLEKWERHSASLSLSKANRYLMIWVLVAGCDIRCHGKRSSIQNAPFGVMACDAGNIMLQESMVKEWGLLNITCVLKLWWNTDWEEESNMF